MNQTAQNIYDYVSKDDLIGAIELLATYYNTNKSSDIFEIVLISRKLYSVKKAVRSGLITWEESDRLRSKIAYNILQLMKSDNDS